MSRHAIREACRNAEAACVAALVTELEGMELAAPELRVQAQALVEAVRSRRRGAGGVDHLMHEFSLSTPEGIALMCLAEALLRVPDAATADRLIRDKLSHGDWQAHLGGRRSLFVNAATWALLLGGKLVAAPSHGVLGQALGGLLNRGGEPLVRRGVAYAMALLARQFVAGKTIAEALAQAAAREAGGYTHSFDMLGEAALSAADAERYRRAYESAIHAIGTAAGGRGAVAGAGVSVKLSALHPRYQRSQKPRVMAELGPALKSLMLPAKRYGIGLSIDAEEAERLELSLDLLESLAADPDLAGWDGLGFVVQAYQKRAIHVVDWLIGLARRQRRRIMLRLVKGAYWDSEIRRAQVDGLADYPVFTRKPHTDLSYLACARRMLAAPDAIYPQFATHNAQTVAAVMQMARRQGIEDYEFQCLHGMGEALYDHLVAAENGGRRCRIYAPVGSHETLLPYLVRRLLENGANSSFVNRIVDESVSIDELLADPLSRVRQQGGAPHPAIPLPARILGAGRLNSAGVDLADESCIAELETGLAQLAARQWSARPLTGVGTAVTDFTAQPLPVLNPADHGDRVGEVTEADAAVVELALATAASCAADWGRTPPATRAAVLLRAADLFEAQRMQLLSLCIREAGKTWSNGLAEIREAVDFCRYYAAQLGSGRRQPADAIPGPVVCISPWNFPLAIFVGQVSAALAAGSPVIAKPAEQTPLIACFAVALLHQAGIPPQVLQLLPGRGETVGAALVADPRVRGVLFTGSTAVAQLINQRIAAREEVRLIAETGGQNAMIVDSSALPEQVVQDVLSSAFDSAGQRCSALRVLCLQHEIADRVLPLLKAAALELQIGNPAQLATDIGPVIDGKARDALLGHVARMREKGRPVWQAGLPAACRNGCFVAPTLIEIDALAELQDEVFGPVLHVLRFAAGDLDGLVAAINATGYGLTLGVHSRIDETVEKVVKAAHVGNIYVNRNMIGAVVGVQPFGGEGLSGTGPKSGGPLYLHALAGSEQVAPADLGCLPAAAPPALRQLAAWAAGSGREALAQCCARYGELSLREVRLELPGATGERNTLSFASRGRLLCLACDADALLEQLAAVLAVDASVVMVDCEPARSIRNALPRELAMLIEFLPQVDCLGLAGVLLTRDLGAAARRPRLADTPGPLIPVFQPGASSALYPLYRMLVERLVSVNTAAAGGNAALMALDDEGPDAAT
ncbi:MAG: bifunctional proline dehydrogenase/L-glutamate gamma-semialdehyde dehydrogenase PutA [Sulfuritalea sp.]|nr:bifunctional proline dehydrogenase/L-glutamate gamma-semialdehyde dehydrogenase PutA [Sulfuritalea sp.]